MKDFRILYFRESVLDDAAEITAVDILEAIEHATAKRPDQSAEVWCDGRRVGQIGTSPAS